MATKACHAANLCAVVLRSGRKRLMAFVGDEPGLGKLPLYCEYCIRLIESGASADAALHQDFEKLKSCSVPDSIKSNSSKVWKSQRSWKRGCSVFFSASKYSPPGLTLWLGSGPINLIEVAGSACSKLPNCGGYMSNLYWLNEDQMARLRPYFPKSHGVPHVDDRRVFSGIIFINRNGLRW